MTKKSEKAYIEKWGKLSLSCQNDVLNILNSIAQNGPVVYTRRWSYPYYRRSFRVAANALKELLEKKSKKPKKVT